MLKRILNMIIQFAQIHFPKNIKPYVIAHKTIKAGILTAQWISEPNIPPGDAFHAIQNAISFKINKIIYSHTKEMGNPKGSVIISNINLYTISPLH